MTGCGHAPNTVACDDQDACTAGDVCAGGACSGAEACCGDGQDNDADGLTDCGDLDCVGAPACGGSPTVLSVGGARPDVCLVWPAYPGCPNVGYSGSLDTSGLSECQHLLEIRATDTDGNQRIIARQRISVTR